MGPRDVDDAIVWLDDHWHGGVFRRAPTARDGGVTVATFLTEATSLEAQLALSYLVWPNGAPDPRVVDEWIRRHGITVRLDVGGRNSCGTTLPRRPPLERRPPI